MDDGNGVAKGTLPWDEVQRRYNNMMDYFAVLGVADSVQKRVSPTKVKSYTGVEIDSVTQTCRVERSKMSKYLAVWRDVKAAALAGPVPRLVFSSLLGKFQHIALLVRGGQQLLREAYMARDHIVAGGEDPWHEGCLVEVGLSAVQDLDAFAALMPSAERRYYLDGGERSENGFFHGPHHTYAR